MKLSDERIGDPVQVACIVSGDQRHIVINVRHHRENRARLAGSEKAVVLRMTVNVEYQRIHEQNVQIRSQERWIQILQDIIVEIIALVLLH